MPCFPRLPHAPLTLALLAALSPATAGAVAPTTPESGQAETAAAGELPSREQMWRMIQTQQRQIEALQRQLGGLQAAPEAVPEVAQEPPAPAEAERIEKILRSPQVKRDIDRSDTE